MQRVVEILVLLALRKSRDYDLLKTTRNELLTIVNISVVNFQFSKVLNNLFFHVIYGFRKVITITFYY